MKYAIGLDCGIASVGYAVMELDANDEPCRIIRMGSRIFDKAEQKKGSSLALPRRKARGARRRLRRHKHRLERIRFLICNEGILTQQELDELYSKPVSDIYQLRCNALDKPVDNAEFARIMINLAQRRGFKSNRKVDTKAKENGALLSAIDENKKRMNESCYRTVGEMLYKDEAYANFKRNKGENYLNTVSRDMIEDEIKQIFAAQRNFGMAFASENIEKLYTDIVLSQRPFDLGPGEGPENSPSQYAGDQIEKMIGKCTFYPDLDRAAKATYSFQWFSLLQKLNNIKIVSNTGDSRFLTDDEKQIIKKLCLKTKNVSYDTIRKKLDIGDEYHFNIFYGKKEVEEVEKKKKFEFLNAYHEIKKVLHNGIESLSIDELDTIGYIFTCYKNDKKIIEKLKESSIDPALHDALLNLPSFSKFGHLSIKALKEITPYLEQGMTYDKACEAAGFDFKAHSSSKSKLLPKDKEYFEDITNHVVKRAISQTIKVVNAIICEQGCQPTYINIELARELSKNSKERNKIKKQQDENKAKNDAIIKELEENFNIINPKGLDIVKLKLYHEQDGIDPYSLKSIEYENLFNVGYVDIDHIVPYSLCFDDSYNNKVLTFSKENRQKGNRLPLQYIADDKKDAYRVWINENVKDVRKKQNFLREKFDKDKDLEFIQRNLNDTRYLSRFLYNFINDNLEFSDFSDGRKRHVTAVNGAITAYVRKRWGINKIREDGDLHHAVDAVVIACITGAMIKRVSDYSKYKELQYSLIDDVDIKTGEVVDKFPTPYPRFRDELDARCNIEDESCLHKILATFPNYDFDTIMQSKPVVVSRMSRHKITGAAHKETIRSPKAINGGLAVSKTSLSDLKLENGKIVGYFEQAAKDDALLYNALKERLKQFDGDGKKAFPKFHKPKADGSPGPVVKKVQTQEKTTCDVLLKDNGVVYGIAKNDSMVRIDVFYVDGEGYYFVPIYVSDTVKPNLPNKACVARKPWKEMDEENFQFSLYKNDLIKVTAKEDMIMTVCNDKSSLPKKKDVNEELLYYIDADVSNASVGVINHDGSYKKSLGIKTLVRIEKYTVDPIGNVHKVNKEKRMSFK